MTIHEQIENYKWSRDFIPSKQHKISSVDFFKLAIEHKGQKGIAEYLGVTTVTVSRWAKSYPELVDGKSRTPLDLKLYTFFGLRPCTQCNEVKELTEFHPDTRVPSGVRTACKSCVNAKKRKKYHSDEEYREASLRLSSEWRSNNPEKMKSYFATRRAKKELRNAAWANKRAIQEIYNNCPPGHEVDHIIPLNGKLVSGLHVENNLQYLTVEENAKKGNRYTVD